MGGAEPNWLIFTGRKSEIKVAGNVYHILAIMDHVEERLFIYLARSAAGAKTTAGTRRRNRRSTPTTTAPLLWRPTAVWARNGHGYGF